MSHSRRGFVLIASGFAWITGLAILGWGRRAEGKTANANLKYKDVQGYLEGNEPEPYFLITGEQMQAGESFDLELRDITGHDVPISSENISELRQGRLIQVFTTENSHLGEPKPHRHSVIFDPNL